MTIEDDMKSWISSADYETLLRKWRFAPAGDPYFQGEIGDFYSKTMFAKRDALADEERVRASKNIGWEKE